MRMLQADRVVAGRVIAIDYSVALEDGDIVETSHGREPVEYLHGTGQLLPGLEHALDGMREGQNARFALEPGDAYGDHDESNVVTLPRSLFPAEAKLEPGLRLAARTSAGQNYPITVVEVHSENVLVDLNHPLAGRRLYFDVTVLAVRDAAESEVFRGEPLSLELV